jgi:hypothetical protein
MSSRQQGSSNYHSISLGFRVQFVGYKLLETYPWDGVPFGEWFGLFCSTLGLAVGPGDKEADEGEGGKGNKRQRAR